MGMLGREWGEGGGTLKNNHATLNETPNARSQQFLENPLSMIWNYL